MGAERYLDVAQLVGLGVLHGDHCRRARLQLRQHRSERVDRGDRLAVDGQDHVGGLQQAVGRAARDRLEEQHSGEVGGMHTEAFEGHDRGDVLGAVHQVTVVFSLLGVGPVAVDRFPAAQVDRLIQRGHDPVEHGQVAVDRHGQEQDLAFGIEHVDALGLHPAGRGDGRAGQEGHRALVDHRVAGQQPAGPLGRREVRPGREPSQHDDETDEGQPQAREEPATASRGWRGRQPTRRRRVRRRGSRQWGS